MDQEIRYAFTAGIDYWCFCQYEPSSALSEAWSLYQKSTLKAYVNWCFIYSYGGFHKYACREETALLLHQNNYERTAEGRPLIFLVRDHGAEPSDVASSIRALKMLFEKTGTPIPYIVAMGGSAGNAHAYYSELGADAISSYGFSFAGSQHTYADLAQGTRHFWASMAQAGLPLLPCATTGWDETPRVGNPLPADNGHENQSTSNAKIAFELGTPEEIADHVQSGLSFIKRNPDTCLANRLLIYAWDEFDEGGWLCPTWTQNGPDATRLQALQSILRK